MSFDPVIDTEEWRLAQNERQRAFAHEIEAEQRSLDPKDAEALEAKWAAQLDLIETKFTEDEYKG